MKKLTILLLLHLAGCADTKQRETNDLDIKILKTQLKFNQSVSDELAVIAEYRIRVSELEKSDRLQRAEIERLEDYVADLYRRAK